MLPLHYRYQNHRLLHNHINHAPLLQQRRSPHLPLSSVFTTRWCRCFGAVASRSRSTTPLLMISPQTLSTDDFTTAASENLLPNRQSSTSSSLRCSLRYRRCSRKSRVHHALNLDPYRGVFGSNGEKYARDVEDLITFGTSGHVASFISEAIQGVGGIIELAPGYFPAVYSSIKKA